MALIKATCSDCGDVELRSKDLTVRICEDTSDATYSFRCPVCRMVEVRTAEEHVVDVLLAAGVRCTEWHLPAELREPHRGPAICHDSQRRRCRARHAGFARRWRPSGPGRTTSASTTSFGWMPTDWALHSTIAPTGSMRPWPGAA
jgi:hypothetical protein